MRWTLWFILVILCGIFQELVQTTAIQDKGIVAMFIISGIVLFFDYNKENRK